MNGRRLAYVILGLVAVLSIVYGVAEATLRLSITQPGNPFPYMWAPEHRQKVAIKEAVPGLQPQQTTFSANALGIRGDELNIDGDEDVTKIMVLGGSVTECLLVDDRDAWPSVAQTRLVDATGKDIWVGNVGRSGQNTLDYVAHAQILVPRIKADIVIAMPGGNDLQAAVEERLLPLDLLDQNLLQRFAAKLYQPGAARIFDAMEPSYALFLLKQRYHAPTTDFSDFYRGMKSARYNSPKLDEIPDLQDHLETYRANLEQLVEATSRLDGTKLVLMTHPFLWKDEMPDEEVRTLWAGYSCMSCPDRVYYSRQALRAALEAINAITLDVCEESGLQCFDLESKVEKNLDNFYDDAHLTTSGSRRVGELVAHFLLDHGVIQ